MTTVAKLTAGVVLYALIGGVAQAQTQTKSTNIVVDPDGLQVEVKDLEGQTSQFEDQQTWDTTVTKIELVDTAGEGFTIDEYQEGFDVYTVVTSGALSLIIARDTSQSSGRIQTTSDHGTNILTVNTPTADDPPTCGGCATVYDVSVSLLDYDCSVDCPACMCSYCIYKPCPDPPPPQGGGQNDCEDHWQNYIECLLQLMTDD